MARPKIVKRRGPAPGSTQSKDFEHVCPAPECPREGRPFTGTQKAVYCSRACNLRAWRKRQAEKETTDAA